MATKQKLKAKDLPVHKVSIGALQLAVWANEHELETGEKRIFHTISLERSYKDKNDEWQKTHQLRESDLGEAICLLQNGQDYLIRTDD